MAIERIYLVLKKHIDRCLNEVYLQIKIEESQEYLKLYNWGEEDDCGFKRYEYTIGLNRLILRVSTEILQGSRGSKIFFQTYLLRQSEEDYSRIDLQRIDALKVIGDYNGNFRFAAERKRFSDSRQEEYDATEILDFGSDYIYQVKEIISKL